MAMRKDKLESLKKDGYAEYNNHKSATKAAESLGSD